MYIKLENSPAGKHEQEDAGNPDPLQLSIMDIEYTDPFDPRSQHLCRHHMAHRETCSERRQQYGYGQRTWQPALKGDCVRIVSNRSMHSKLHPSPKIRTKKEGSRWGTLKSGVDILSRRSSTICAGGLNFSVRNGKRWTSPQ